jgi:hypothetical protein
MREPARVVHCSSVIGTPAGVSHAMSSRLVPRTGRPWKNRRQRNTGWSWRSRMSRAVNSVSHSKSRARSQSAHEVSSTAQPRQRVVRTVHLIGIPLPQGDAGQITVPPKPVNLRQVELPLTARLIEQDQHHAMRNLGEHRKIRASAVIGTAKRVSITRPHLHVHMMARGGTDLTQPGKAAG